jgi:hypothetical protein
MINYDLLFMAQGIVDSIYEEELDKCYNHYSTTLAMPIMILLWGANIALF